MMILGAHLNTEKLNKENTKLVNEIVENTTSTNCKYDNIQNSITDFVQLLNNLDLSTSDFEEDGLSTIVSRDAILSERESQAKSKLDNGEHIDSPVLRDLAFIDKYSDDYFYINGYDRLNLVTNDDLYAETEDLIDYINSKN